MTNAAAASLAILLMIYNGALTTPQTTITVGSWGAGRCVQVNDVGYQKLGALGVVVLGSYEGARLDFAKSLDFTPYFEDTKNAYIEFWVLPLYDAAGNAITTDAYRPPAAGGFEALPILDTRFKSLSTLRVTLSGPEGMISAAPCDLVPFTLGERGWRRIDVPINKFLPKPKDAFHVERLVIGGSPAEQFYIGQLAVIRDTTPIKVTVIPHDTQVTAGEATKLEVEVDGGAAQTRVTWDFDVKDGIQEDAVGSSVMFWRNEAGDYTITFTTTDVNQNKPPVTDTMRIKVVQ